MAFIFKIREAKNSRESYLVGKRSNKFFKFSPNLKGACWIEKSGRPCVIGNRSGRKKVVGSIKQYSILKFNDS